MSNFGFKCEGRVINTVFTVTRYDNAIDEAWDNFEEQLKSIAEILDTDDYEVIRVSTKVHP